MAPWGDKGGWGTGPPTVAEGRSMSDPGLSLGTWNEAAAGAFPFPRGWTQSWELTVLLLSSLTGAAWFLPPASPRSHPPPMSSCS